MQNGEMVEAAASASIDERLQSIYIRKGYLVIGVSCSLPVAFELPDSWPPRLRERMPVFCSTRWRVTGEGTFQEMVEECTEAGYEVNLNGTPYPYHYKIVAVD